MSDAHDPLDTAALSKLRSLLGDAKIALLMSRLSQQLETTLTESALQSSDRSELARVAHAAVSSAGVLGFKAFAVRCADLEVACATNRDISDLRARVLDERRRVAERMARAPSFG